MLPEPLSGVHIPAFPGPMSTLGDSGILKTGKLALFCSVKCPGEPIIMAYDLARALRDAGVTVISGFQSPIEKDCLTLLLRGKQPVIICPARSLHVMRLPATWKKAIEQDRLLLLSPFAERFRRPTVELTEKRNEFVASLADRVIFAHAEPGGKTEALAQRVISTGKPVFTLNSKENANLVALGARPMRVEEIARECASTEES